MIYKSRMCHWWVIWASKKLLAIHVQQKLTIFKDMNGNSGMYKEWKGFVTIPTNHEGSVRKHKELYGYARKYFYKKNGQV